MPLNDSENLIVTGKLYLFTRDVLRVMLLEAKLFVDGEEIHLNEFVVKILGGTIVGAVTSLRGIKKDWKEIEVKVSK